MLPAGHDGATTGTRTLASGATVALVARGGAFVIEVHGPRPGAVRRIRLAPAELAAVADVITWRRAAISARIRGLAAEHGDDWPGYGPAAAPDGDGWPP